METLQTVIVTVLVTLAGTHFAWKMWQGETVVAYLQRIARCVAYPCAVVAVFALACLVLGLVFGAPYVWFVDNFGEVTGDYYRSEFGHGITRCIMTFWAAAILGLVAGAFGGMFAEGGTLSNIFSKEDNAPETPEE